MRTIAQICGLLRKAECIIWFEFRVWIQLSKAAFYLDLPLNNIFRVLWRNLTKMAHSSMVKRQTIKAGFKASNVSGIFVHRNLRVNYVPRAPSTRGPERHEKKKFICVFKLWANGKICFLVYQCAQSKNNSDKRWSLFYLKKNTCSKGQLISKCLFGVFNFFQKRTKTRCIQGVQTRFEPNKNAY